MKRIHKKPMSKFLALVVVAMIALLAHDGNWPGVLVFALLGSLAIWASRHSPHDKNRRW